MRNRLVGLTCVLALGAGVLVGNGANPVVGAGPDAGDDEAPLAKRIDQSGRELNRIRQQIASHREKIASLTSEERDAERELADLVHEMDLIRDLLAGLDERERILQQQGDSLRVLLDRFHDDLGVRQEILARRMRTVFMGGEQANLELILTADSFSSLITRLRFATLMARIDQRMMDQTRDEGRRIEAAQRQLRTALAGIWESREEASRERERLTQMEQEHRAILAYAQRERQKAESDLAELQANEKRLADLLASLEYRRKGTPQAPLGSQLAAAAGTLKWPVAGKVVRPFGRSIHPKFQTVTLNNGINIAAPLGSPVYAVAPGRVEFADHLPGFGLCVILDHGAGYYTLYAHLGRRFVEKGAAIARNEILAEVGTAEEEGGSQLYFEIRRGKTPLDPLDWLEPR